MVIQCSHERIAFLPTFRCYTQDETIARQQDFQTSSQRSWTVLGRTDQQTAGRIEATCRRDRREEREMLVNLDLNLELIPTNG